MDYNTLIYCDSVYDIVCTVKRERNAKNNGAIIFVYVGTASIGRYENFDNNWQCFHVYDIDNKVLPACCKPHEAIRTLLKNAGYKEVQNVHNN